jgi:hypothetical protein
LSTFGWHEADNMVVRNRQSGGNMIVILLVCFHSTYFLQGQGKLDWQSLEGFWRYWPQALTTRTSIYCSRSIGIASSLDYPISDSFDSNLPSNVSIVKSLLCKLLGAYLIVALASSQWAKNRSFLVDGATSGCAEPIFYALVKLLTHIWCLQIHMNYINVTRLFLK